ncbi:hypothetical protein B0H14DRAFT_2619501 [Mycena olivaceomarginata]|nr:hypothetical protein B0H14DRAFT_2619501 [Mycena olivaceomarginata]
MAWHPAFSVNTMKLIDGRLFRLFPSSSFLLPDDKTTRLAYLTMGLSAEGYRSLKTASARFSSITPDPYGVKDYDAMEEGEDDADTTPPPLVIRQHRRYVGDRDLHRSQLRLKLTKRFAPDQGMPKQPVAQPAKKPAKAPTAKWTEKDAD